MLRWTLLSCLTAATCAGAVEIDLAPEELHIPVGEALPLEFGTLPQLDTTILLEITARMDSPGLGGSMYFMHLALNGRPVLPAKTRTVTRLVNKPLVSPVSTDLPAPWHGSAGWRVLYAPDFEAARAQTYYVGDPYTLVLDVTDLTNPAAENRLEITNNATAGLARRLEASLDLVIGALRVRTEPGASPTMTPDAAVEPVINRGEAGAGPAAYRGELLPGGGFTLTVGDTSLAFSSAFSYPNAGLNHFAAGAPDRRGHPRWRVEASPADDGGSVTATCPDYTVRRVVRFLSRRVEVTDEITNAHADAKLGLLVRHEADLSPFPESGVRLAGNPDVSLNDYHAPGNPSVHITLGEIGVGLICEDDVFRNQARLFFDADSGGAGLRTEMLLLQPGETYALRWSVYPVASRSYYDFINLVRHDWGANYTVEGPWCFFTPDMILDMPEDHLAEALERLGINFACSWGGWVDRRADPRRIGFGTGVLEDYWADYRRRLREATEKLRRARPGIKVLVYYDSQRDTHANAGELYPDSLLTNARGQHMSTEWSGQYSLTWSMVATLKNSFGRAMLEVVDAYMDDIGADGLYWDEMENVGYGSPLLTYAIPDGRSCLLDPDTYTIRQDVGITTLLGEEHRLAVIDRTRARGGTLMGNGPTTTRRLLQRHVQRMVEIQHNDYWCYEGNLDSPLGYASGRRDFGNVTRALEMATLLVGTRLDYEYETCRYTFPFTPVELHHGYLLGEERIITMHSGRYGWPGETVPCRLLLFDAEGKLRETREVTAGPERVPVELGEGEVAILERVQ